MLVLTRKINQAIVIGDDIRVTMTSIGNGHVRVGIDAPPGVRILREELLFPPPIDEPDRRRPRAMAGPRGTHHFPGRRDS